MRPPIDEVSQVLAAARLREISDEIVDLAAGLAEYPANAFKMDMLNRERQAIVKEFFHLVEF